MRDVNATNISNSYNQNGSALIISLILLTILSLVGIGSASNAVLEEKMSANSQLKTTTYQITKGEVEAHLTIFKRVDISPLNDGLSGNTQVAVNLSG